MGIARRELLDLIKERWNDLFSDFVHYNHSWKRFHLIITIMIQKSRREENHEKERIHLQTAITTKRWKILTNLERDWSVLRPDKRLKQVCCRYNKSNSLQNLRRQTWYFILVLAWLISYCPCPKYTIKTKLYIQPNWFVLMPYVCLQISWLRLNLRSNSGICTTSNLNKPTSDPTWHLFRYLTQEATSGLFILISKLTAPL